MANVDFEQRFRQAHPRRPVHYDLVFLLRIFFYVA